MRRLPLLLIPLLLLLGLTACGDDSGGDDESFDPPGSTEASGELPDGTVVFTPDEAEQSINGEPTTWTPGVEDVVAAEDLLSAYLDDHPELDLDAFDTYHRQYVGTGPDDGHLVSVNALCESSGLDDWEDELIFVADGGTCFWQADVFVPEGIVSNVSVNGYA